MTVALFLLGYAVFHPRVRVGQRLLGLLKCVARPAPQRAPLPCLQQGGCKTPDAMIRPPVPRVQAEFCAPAAAAAASPPAQQPPPAVGAVASAVQRAGPSSQPALLDRAAPEGHQSLRAADKSSSMPLTSDLFTSLSAI